MNEEGVVGDAFGKLHRSIARILRGGDWERLADQRLQLPDSPSLFYSLSLR